jgi:hypothetical protein
MTDQPAVSPNASGHTFSQIQLSVSIFPSVPFRSTCRLMTGEIKAGQTPRLSCIHAPYFIEPMLVMILSSYSHMARARKCVSSDEPNFFRDKPKQQVFRQQRQWTNQLINNPELIIEIKKKAESFMSKRTLENENQKEWPMIGIKMGIYELKSKKRMCH